MRRSLDPWQEAVDAYEKGLTEKERELFAHSNPEDVLHDVMQQEANHRQASRTRALLDKIQPLLDSIEDYGKALDVISNSSPTLLCPLWGSLRILLRVAQGYNRYYKKLLEMLERIGDVLPRYSTYSSLFGKHKPLQDAISSAYRHIISFLMDAKKVFSRTSFRFICRLMWKSFDIEFGARIEQLRRYRALVEHQARLASVVEAIEERREAGEERGRMKQERELAAESRRRIEDIKNSIGNQEQDMRMVNIKKWLKPRLCNSEKESLRKLRSPQSCEWVLRRDELSKWIHQPDSQKGPDTQILWIHGPPGCGKSFLYSRLLDHLEILELPILYFLFCDGDGERTSSHSLLRSWTLQLIKLFPEAAGLSEDFRIDGEERVATPEEVMKLFRLLLEKSPDCYLTVDGLDECSDRKDFLNLLPEIPERFKILILSRESMDIKASILRLSRTVSLLPIGPDETKSAINQYISRRLESECASFGPKVIDKIKHRLSDCDGMFLWVRLMFEELQSQTNDFDRLRCLDELPNGLNEMYDRMLQKLSKLSDSQRMLAHKVFFWIRIVRRPVSITELCALLAIRPAEQEFDQTRLEGDSDKTIPFVCCQLVQIRQPGNLVTAIHFTVNQFLERYLEENNIFQQVAAYYGTSELKSGNSLAAAVCLAYLSLPVVEELQDPCSSHDLSNLVNNDESAFSILSYASLYWVEHLRDASELEPLLENLATGFLSDKVPNMETWWHIYCFLGPDSEGSAICPSEFSGLHIVAYFGLSRLVSPLVKTSKSLIVDGLGRSPLWWAASMGHSLTTIALLETGFDPNSPDDYAITPVHRAAAGGHLEVLNSILARQEELTELVRDSKGWTPLHWATSRNHVNIVHSILSIPNGRKQYGTRTSLTFNGRTPLHLAALNGHAAGIGILVGFCPGLYLGVLNIRDVNGLTALHLAAMYGHMHVVEKLIEAGADVTQRDKSGKTAATKSRIMGYDDIALFLVASQANVESIIPRRSASLVRIEKVATALERYSFVDVPVALNSRDTQDFSALQTVVNGHYLSLVGLDKKKEWRKADRRGRNVLHHSAAGGYDDCIKEILALVTREVDGDSSQHFFDTQDERGWTALHYAAAGNFSMATTLLIAAGASPNIVNTAGMTPYGVAVYENHQEVMETMAKFTVFPTNDLANDFKWTDSHRYAREGDTTKMQAARRGSEELRKPDVFGRFPIYRAAEVGKYEVVKAIADGTLLTLEETLDLAIISSENPSYKDTLHFFLSRIPSGMLLEEKCLQIKALRLLFVLTERNDRLAVKALCEAGVDINSLNPSNPWFMQTALGIAILNGNSDLAKLLIDQGASVSVRNGDGLHPIHLACRASLPDVVSVLLQHGADPNVQIRTGRPDSDEGRAPLHCAISVHIAPENQLKTIKVLLDHGADVRISDSRGCCAIRKVLDISFELQRLRKVQKLEDFSAMFDFFECLQPSLFQAISLVDGFLPIHLTAKHGDVDFIKEALDAGVAVDWWTLENPLETPLKIAVECGQLEVVNLLLEYGPDLYYPTIMTQYTGKKEMIVSLARRKRFHAITEILLVECKRRGIGHLVPSLAESLRPIYPGDERRKRRTGRRISERG